MADAALDKPMIVNWSLAELGLAPAFSIDDATDIGRYVDIFWPRAVARCFGLSDWTFCRKTFKLTRQQPTPENGYAYGFDLPGGILGEPYRTWYDPRSKTPLRDTRIEGRTLYCDEAVAYAVCKVPVEPDAWDPQFADCFAVALAAYLAVPMLQDVDMAEKKERAAFGPPQEGGAGGMFGRLLAQNRAAGPVGSSLLASDPLTAAHGGAWHGRY